MIALLGAVLRAIGVCLVLVLVLAALGTFMHAMDAVFHGQLWIPILILLGGVAFLGLVGACLPEETD